MYLTDLEHEAFIRGKAANLIPENYPLPSNERESRDLIYQIGVLFCAKVAYRNFKNKLCIMDITTFSKEHLDYVVENLDKILYKKVFSTTNLRQNTYPFTLNRLYNYFAFGKEIVSQFDLDNRLPRKKTCAKNILKGFEIDYQPCLQSNLATGRQKDIIAEMICKNLLPKIDRRKWCNMTKNEASQMISSVKKQNVAIPTSAKIALEFIKNLPQDEQVIIDKILNQRREIA